MKKWDTPKLIVLARGKPEEATLLACKIGDAVGLVATSSPNVTNPGCFFSSPSAYTCLGCSSISDS